jgi:hypothetical protein
MGVLYLAKGQNFVTLEQILALNELVYNRLEQFRNYLYIKNQKYDFVRSVILSN